MGELFNVWEAVWTVISFAIFLFLLTRLFYRPVMKMLEERRQTIESGLAEARKAREQAEALNKEYEERLAAAQREAQAIIDRAEQTAERYRQERLQAAQEEAEQLLERARERIERERDDAIAALRREAADLAVLAAERIIRKQLNADEHRRLAEEAIAEVGRVQ